MVSSTPYPCTVYLYLYVFLNYYTGTPTQKKNQDAKRNKTEIMKWESEIHELNYELALKGTKQKS